jgi:hypothetical protein
MWYLERKLLRRARQEPSSPVLELRSRFPRKSVLRSLANYVKSMGAHIPCTLSRSVTSTRKREDGTVKANFHIAKKAGKKINPAKQSFAQLSKKLDKLEKSLKKASLKSKKHHRDDSNSNSK